MTIQEISSIVLVAEPVLREHNYKGGVQAWEVADWIASEHDTAPSKEEIEAIALNMMEVLGNNEEVKHTVYTVYAKDNDMTFIMEEEEQDNRVKVTVKGFYYGEPNEDNTKQFYNDLTAEFDIGDKDKCIL